MKTNKLPTDFTVRKQITTNLITCFNDSKRQHRDPSNSTSRHAHGNRLQWMRITAPISTHNSQIVKDISQYRLQLAI